jgi:hypothetical protein
MSRPPSHNAVLWIVDAAMEARVRGFAVEREREVAKRIGGVRCPVVHRARAQRLQLVVVMGAAELERVDAARICWHRTSISAETPAPR